MWIFGKNGTEEKCLIFMPRINIWSDFWWNEQFFVKLEWTTFQNLCKFLNLIDVKNLKCIQNAFAEGKMNDSLRCRTRFVYWKQWQTRNAEGRSCIGGVYTNLRMMMIESIMKNCGIPIKWVNLFYYFYN